MNVKELIQQLQEMPQEAKVSHLWDGSPYTDINVVYEAKDGSVITSDYDQVCYDDYGRPKDAPTSEEMQFWKTKVNPNPWDDDDE